MDLDDLQPRKKLPEIVLGEDISAFPPTNWKSESPGWRKRSRCAAAIKARQATKSAAEGFFKK